MATYVAQKIGASVKDNFPIRLDSRDVAGDGM